MPETIIINTEKESTALIPDKWVIGTGLSTNSLYVTHTDAPLMIVQYQFDDENDQGDEAPCTVYIKGEIKPEVLNKLFSEAWELIEIYKARHSNLDLNAGVSPKSVI